MIKITKMKTPSISIETIRIVNERMIRKNKNYSAIKTIAEGYIARKKLNTNEILTVNEVVKLLENNVLSNFWDKLRR